MATKHDVEGIGHALEDLFAVLLERKNSIHDESYVSLLYRKGEDSILKKVGEEAAEVIIASKGGDREHLVHELVDLWFHCMVLMGHKDVTLEELADEFRRRMGVSGIAEKASRKDH